MTRPQAKTFQLLEEIKGQVISLNGYKSEQCLALNEAIIAWIEKNNLHNNQQREVRDNGSDRQQH